MTAEPHVEGELLRLAAFAGAGAGGNPAGVWLGGSLPSPHRMQQIATEVGYSETAFNARVDDRRWVTRFYSPRAEVSFCGHATIATGVALGARLGTGVFQLDTAVGDVVVEVDQGEDGALWATLTSVEPEVRPLPSGLLQVALRTFGWSESVLSPALPAGLAYAGAWHLVVPLASRTTLAAMRYDFRGLLDLMHAHDLTTVQLVHRSGDREFHARDPFPVGGVVEDPATGAAAAAFGAHLRAHRLVSTPTRIAIHQGYDMGRPSELLVEIPQVGGIKVSGSAASIRG